MMTWWPRVGNVGDAGNQKLKKKVEEGRTCSDSDEKLRNCGPILPLYVYAHSPRPALVADQIRVNTVFAEARVKYFCNSTCLFGRYFLRDTFVCTGDRVAALVGQNGPLEPSVGTVRVVRVRLSGGGHLTLRLWMASAPPQRLLIFNQLRRIPLFSPLSPVTHCPFQPHISSLFPT